MLIQIGEKSATVTPFGSLASGGYRSDGTPNVRLVRYRRPSPAPRCSDATLIEARCDVPHRGRTACPYLRNNWDDIADGSLARNAKNSCHRSGAGFTRRLNVVTRAAHFKIPLRLQCESMVRPSY
jgi:hypothetical protein